MCAQVLGQNPRDLYEETAARQGEDSCYWLDSGKLRALGWAPQVPLLGAIARVHGWLKDYPELLGMSTEYRLRA
jgi:dTDP-D-glucose 4,6-dehydratase